MKLMRLAAGLVFASSLVLTQAVPSKGSALTRPGNWKAELGGVDIKACDGCRCGGDRRRRCNENGFFGDEDISPNKCHGDRWWSAWGVERRQGCSISDKTGKAVIVIEQRRQCGCSKGEVPQGGCWEGIMGLSIDSMETCKSKCLCRNGQQCQCQLTPNSVRRKEMPAGPFYCEATSLLPHCNDNGTNCKGYAVTNPNDPNHPQSQGKLSSATGAYTCPDMWPRVAVGEQEQAVTVTARCGCGYKGTQTRTCRSTGCGAAWDGAGGAAGGADRSQCIKIDWEPGCGGNAWGECKLNSPNATCGTGTQRCRRRCNTESSGGNYEDCVHAAHAGCIDPTMVLRRDCNVGHADWTKWGPWGWVREGKFHVGYDPEAGVYDNPKAIFYDNEDTRGFDKRCGSAKQQRFYQCSSGKRKDCLDACRYNCYAGEAQEAICRSNKKIRPLSGRTCQCEELDKGAIVCPGGSCDQENLTINVKQSV